MEQRELFEPPAEAAVLPKPPATRESEPPLPEGAPCPLPAGLTELISPSFARTVEHVFAAMDVAEQEIEAAKGRYPRLADRINQSFRYLSPTAVLEKTSLDVYRHHAREILERVAGGQKLAPGTDAELLAAMSGISQAAPPSRELTLLYMKLFRELYPDQAAEFFEGITPDLYEEERMAELESELRRKLATERDCHKV